MSGGVDRLVGILNMALDAAAEPRSGRVSTVATRTGTASTIDEEDARWAQLVRWHSHRSGMNVYLCATYSPGLHVNLHGHMLPPRPRSAGQRIDVTHADGDSLNNRRANLRYALHSTSVARGLARRTNDSQLDDHEVGG